MRRHDRAASFGILWACIALFFARVVGQVEVLLVEPAWLPAMAAWYSGLLPYPVLLPAQIALLMLMCALTIRTSAARPTSTASSAARFKVLRALAMLYFVAMAVRLVLCVYQYGGDYYLHGAIPIAFHWVLALFALTLLRSNTPQDEVEAADTGWVRNRTAFTEDIGQAVRLYGAESVGGAD